MLVNLGHSSGGGVATLFKSCVAPVSRQTSSYLSLFKILNTFKSAQMQYNRNVASDIVVECCICLFLF